MISVDTNILVYAANPKAKEHEQAREYLSAFQNREFVLCELILMELYLKLRNPKIFTEPYSSAQAAQFCNQLKSNPHWQVIDYHPSITPKLWKWAEATTRNYRNFIDARIAYTLQYHGVTKFITANTKDFKEFEFEELINPITS